MRDTDSPAQRTLRWSRAGRGRGRPQPSVSPRALARRDSTSENRTEITLNAAKRRAGSSSAAEALRAAKEVEEKALQEKRRASRVALAARASVFENGPADAGA